QEEIVRLRQLARMSEGGIIRGHVTRPVWNDAEKVQTQTEVLHHKIVAHRVDNGVEYDASTDENGNYEFDALPYGRYELNANTSVGWWAEEGEVEVHTRGCSYVSLELYPDGLISGQVLTRGEPAKYVAVAITPASAESSEFHSVTADEQGHFEFRGV